MRKPPTRQQMALANQREADRTRAMVANAKRAHGEMMRGSTDAVFGYLPQPGGRALALPSLHTPQEYNATGLGGYLDSSVGKWSD